MDRLSWKVKAENMNDFGRKMTAVIGLASFLGLPALGQSNAVSTSKFQLTFPTTWGFLSGQDASTASETDSTAIRGTAGGLNGQALMAWLSTPGAFDIATLPQQVLVGGATGVFTKVKDSTATYGSYAFQIADFTYDSLTFPPGFLPATLPLTINPKGKMRVYATQVGDHHFVLALASILLGPNAKLPYADAETALKTLKITPTGAGIVRFNQRRLRGKQVGSNQHFDGMGRQGPNASSPSKASHRWFSFKG
jgi:hypothetical protein